MTRTFSSVAEIRAAVGKHLGYSEWLLVDQSRIDLFADATGDHQWIHVDPERAAAGPFGRTVAHGYLTLALVPALAATVVDYAGWRVRINYGSNKVRFPSPVLVDSEVRAGVEVVAVDETADGAQVVSTVTIESRTADGVRGAKPALVAELVTRLAAPQLMGGPTGDR